MDEVALVVGEALVDVVRARDGSERDHAGGSSANAAVAMSRLGREVWFASAWADDAHGALLATHLADNDVRLAVDPLVLERTATAVATLAEDGSASYAFDIEWRVPELALPGHVTPAVVVYGSIGAALAPGADVVHDLVAGSRDSALTVFDVNARPAITGAGEAVVARAERMARLADVVKASDEDLETLWPGVPHREVATRLLVAGTGAVVITRGGAGVSWYAATGDVDVPAPSVAVVDTIGAGDTVTAAVVDALWELGVAGAGAGERLRALGRSEWTTVLEFAARAAAVTVSRPGGDPPHRHELG
jgi:fructokinase